MSPPIILLPLAPERLGETKPDETVKHPHLPFTREIGLQEEVLDWLCTPYRNEDGSLVRRDGWRQTPGSDHSSFCWRKIAAIKLVREITGNGLLDSKDFVDKIEQDFAGQIAVRRAKLIKAWRSNQNGLQKSVSSSEPVEQGR